jgi:glycosyltransferase involved in cell wall biosynthesis
MLKAADAFGSAGYSVRVVSGRSTDWAMSADDAIKRTRSWRWTVVNFDRRTARAAYLRSGIRFRLSRAVASIAPSVCPIRLCARAYRRAHPELVREAAAEPADLFYGGGGALITTAAAARQVGAPYALDLEDFHSAEQTDSSEDELSNRIAERIEWAVLPGAAFLTAAGEAIAGAYTRKYGVRPIVINNTFPLPRKAPGLIPSSGEGLRLYWFSQTIGPGRGLEDAVAAMGLAGIPGELHLRGSAIPEYLEALRHFAASSAPRLRVVHHEPAPPDAMGELCCGYDVGLAVEQPVALNRSLCLTNKAFTYLLGGLAVVFTDTPGQRSLARDLGEGALVYPPGDVAALAAGLRRWANNKALLSRAMAAAWEAAKRRWHWEHALERGALLEAAASALTA